MSDKKKIDDGGPAFPLHPENTMTLQDCRGMTLRQWYAGKALQGYLSAPGTYGQQARDNSDVAAEWAYIAADAMIEAGKTKP